MKLITQRAEIASADKDDQEFVNRKLFLSLYGCQKQWDGPQMAVASVDATLRSLSDERTRLNGPSLNSPPSSPSKLLPRPREVDLADDRYGPHVVTLTHRDWFGPEGMFGVKLDTAHYLSAPGVYEKIDLTGRSRQSIYLRRGWVR